MDEGSLFTNLKDKPILDFSQPLTGDQLAPFGFLIAERLLLSVLGTSRYVARFIPWCCGIASLFLFARLARRVLPRRPALVALALFACSDDLIYYSSELKPYTVDLAVGLALSLGALGTLRKPISERLTAALAIGTLLAPWCSFPSAFVVVACGATLIVKAIHSGRYGNAAVWGTIGIAWLASFLVCYDASKSLLSPYTTMYYFWDFAFLLLNPLSRGSLSKAIGILLEVFVNPLNLVAPTWPWAGVILPVSFMLIGGVSLVRRSTAEWAILVLPIALAMVASLLKRYSFHGRLILELVPALFLLIAEGTEVIHRMDSGRVKLVYKVVLVLLLAYPCLSGIYRATEKRDRDFNQHGDLRYNIFMK